MDNTLNTICRVVTGFEGDTFIGIKVENGTPEVTFPIGYNLSNDDKGLREDIFLLITTLKKYRYREKELGTTIFSDTESNTLPIFAYQRMIQRYFDYGTYTEYEVTYKPDKKGRINWAKTIKNIKPIIQGTNAVYTDFIIRDSSAKEHTLIAEIFQYCVYISFQKIGWLYSQKKFVKPRIKYNQKLFIGAIREKLNVSYSDKDKELFNDMLTIVSDIGSDKDIFSNYSYGTYSFEYVWEKLIDSTFGIKNKQEYFPKTKWTLQHKGIQKENHCLEPDTILIQNDTIYVIDAKYYKYGVTGIPSHLPDTSSVQKQITYGEYIHTYMGISPDRIYNAFLMPANLEKGISKDTDKIVFIGVATSDWKQNNYPYEHVAGILIDTKFLMLSNNNKQNIKDLLCQRIKTNI